MHIHLRRLLTGTLGQRGWVSFVAIVLLFSGLFVWFDGTYTEEPPLMVPVGNGVMYEFDHRTVGVNLRSWDGHMMSFSDGIGVITPRSVTWYLNSTSLDDGSCSAFYNGTRIIGSLEVSLTLVDELGDGLVGPGDKFLIVPENGTAFAEDQTYSVWFNYRHGLLNPGLKINFVFHGTYVESWIPPPIFYL